MVMTWVYTLLLSLAILASWIQGTGAQLGAAVLAGAQKGISLAISISGSLCLWCGVQALLRETGVLEKLQQRLRRPLERLFPASRTDPALAQALSGNFCANLLGLGNAATPMGIQAAKRMARGCNGVASDELCRLVVLNTASIQLLPTNVAAIRAGLGCAHPFDILLPVWITSLSSAGLGILAAFLLGKVWPHG